MASLVEIFSSIQGEGIYVGVRQIFLRFSGCNLNCSYCDTAHDLRPTFRVEFLPGTGKFTCYPNPVQPEKVAEIISKFNLKKHHSISLTGGEPLLQVEFIEKLSFFFKKKGIKLFLETNGTLPSQLAKLISVLDIISMDIKLPSVAGGGEMWDTHRDFLAIGSQKDIFVKIVVAADTSEAEITKACEIIKKVDPKIPLIIQPVTPQPEFSGEKPSAVKLLTWQELARDYINDVRVIPQIHKFLGQL